MTDNPPIRTYVHLDFLTHETMKLLGGTKSKITKDETGENVPHLEISEAALLHCNNWLKIIWSIIRCFT